ncbi:MAG: hypothetical protein HC767_00895 [Akkermansiaceae bacterium]|nr:hypothetical protein [Akkermansiaceae bacterium]
MVLQRHSERIRIGSLLCTVGHKRRARGRGQFSVRCIATPTHAQDRVFAVERSELCCGVLQAVVAGKRDPGYLETSRIAVEAGMCLALQGEELTAKGHLQGGVLTPASAMGSVLRERLQAADIRFEITKTGKEVPTSPLDKLKAGTKAAGASGSDKNAAAPSGVSKQLRHVPAFGFMHAVAAKLQHSLHQREKFAPQEKLLVGFDHLHPAVNERASTFTCIQQ